MTKKKLGEPDTHHNSVYNAYLLRLDILWIAGARGKEDSKNLECLTLISIVFAANIIFGEVSCA